MRTLFALEIAVEIMRRNGRTRRTVLGVIGSLAVGISGCTDLNSNGSDGNTSGGDSTANVSGGDSDGGSGDDGDGGSSEGSTDETLAISRLEETWPQARYGPRNTGARPGASGPEQLAETWMTTLEAETVGAPIVADDVVVAATAGTDDAVSALDASSGDVLWSATTDAVPQTEPVVGNGRVFVAGESDEIYGVDTAQESAGEVESVFSGPPIFGAPAVTTGVLYFGDDQGFLWSLYPVEDEYRWTNGLIEGAIHSPTTVADGTCYAGSEGGDLKACTASDGKDVLRMRTGEPVRGAPSVTDERIVFGTTEGTVYAGPTEDDNENLGNPDPTWTASVPGAVETAVPVTDNTAFVGDASGTLTALDVSDGSTAWTFEADGDSISHPPAVADGTVYYHAGGSELFAIDAASGETQESTDVGESLAGAPSLAGGTLYVASDAGVHALSEE